MFESRLPCHSLLITIYCGWKAFFIQYIDKNIKVGQLRTRLAIEGQEHSGPRKAAEQLLAFIKEQ